MFPHKKTVQFVCETILCKPKNFVRGVSFLLEEGFGGVQEESKHLLQIKVQSRYLPYYSITNRTIVELLESRPKLILAKLDRTKILKRARRARFNILVRSNLAILTEVYSPIIDIT